MTHRLKSLKTDYIQKKKSQYIASILLGPDSRLIRIFPHAFDLRMVSFVCDAKPAFYSAVRIGLWMISAWDVGRCVAKLTRALERNYSQLNWRFRIWCLKYKSREKFEGHSYEKKVLASIASNTYQYFFSYRQSPMKIFFRICSEFFSDFLVLMLWYIVWYYEIEG